jgi:hypothetical protein
MLRLFSKEFDADQLSRSPNNCAIMSGAVSSDQQDHGFEARSFDKPSDLFFQ